MPFLIKQIGKNVKFENILLMKLQGKESFSNTASGNTKWHNCYGGNLKIGTKIPSAYTL